MTEQERTSGKITFPSWDRHTGKQKCDHCKKRATHERKFKGSRVKLYSCVEHYKHTKYKPQLTGGK